MEIVSTQIPEADLAHLLLFSFRYCLGNVTYATYFVNMMVQHWDLLAPWHQEIQDDIKRARERGDAGSLAEVKDWEKVLRLPVEHVSAARWHDGATGRG
jgi:hypothetical protein